MAAVAGPAGSPCWAEPSIEIVEVPGSIGFLEMTGRRRRLTRHRLGDGRHEVAAELDRLGRRADRLRRPLVDEVGLEVGGDLLLLGGDELLLDRRARLRQRLGRLRVDRGNLEHVPAAIGLERPDDLALGRRECLLLELRIPLTLGQPLEEAATVLGRLVLRVLRGDLLPARVGVVGLEGLLGLLGLRLRGVEDHPDVAARRLLEAVDVDLVELLDLVVGDRRLRDHLLLELVAEQRQLDLLLDVGLAELRLLDELLELLLAREALFLDPLQLGVDVLLGHGDAAVGGLALDPLGEDQALHRLLDERVVLGVAGRRHLRQARSGQPPGRAPNRGRPG